jgi:hypothetical protein
MMDATPDPELVKAFNDAALTGRRAPIGKVNLPPFRIISAHELLAMELPVREMILAPWLPEKGLAMVYGPRGIGKTHFISGCAWAIASGGKFLGWQAPKPRKVLVIDGEMPIQVMQERLEKLAKDGGQEPAFGFLNYLPLDILERGLDLSNTDDQEALEPFLAGIDLIFVDNISSLVRGGKENEAESWLPVQQWALEQRRAGRSLAFVHHAGKGGQQRGTSRREDVLDTVISLRRPPDYAADQGACFEVHFEKNRGFFGEDAKPLEAALGLGGWAMRDIGDAELARVVALSADGLSVRDIAGELGLSNSTVNRLQKKARETGKLTTPAPKPGRRKSRSDPPDEYGDD